MEKNKTVKVYSTPTCPWCAKTKEFLKKHNVSYVNKDVSSDKKSAHEMFEKSGQISVPVIDIDGKVIVGFNETEIKKALKI